MSQTPRAPSRHAVLSRRAFLAAGVAFAGLLGKAARAADAYPTRPIRLVVPFAPGGAVDIVGRLAAHYLSEELGQQVYVENKSGAGGSLGTDMVVRAQPDGYTLLLHTVSSAVINALTYTNLPYDPRKDLVPITEIAASQTLIVINAQVPAATLGAVRRVGAEKSRPLQVRVDRGRQQRASRRPAVRDARGPRHGARALSRRGRRHQGSRRRRDPDGDRGGERVPAVHPRRQAAGIVRQRQQTPRRAAGGADGRRGGTYRFRAAELVRALCAPRDFGRHHQRIYKATAKVLQLPELRARLEEFALDGIGSSPAEMAAYLDAQFAFWTPVVAASGVRLRGNDLIST